jgi:hypothetical protein
MYVRIARFEGIDPDQIDAQVADMKRQLEGMRSGDLPPDAPEHLQALRETVRRVTQLVDRESGTALAVVFCETEEDVRRADSALDEMSPGEGEGRRTGVEIFEVALDEAMA